MSVSEHEVKMITLQQQVKENQLDLHDYMADLNSWTSDISVKDDALAKQQLVEEPKLPPVRNSLHKKKRKKVKKKQQEEHTENGEDKTKRISGYDYRAWDKFDIDKACNDVEGNSSSEYETDDEWEMERKKHLAEKEKDDGNEHFKKGMFELAVESYTRGINLDPTNAILPANRAMAYLKLNMYAEAALDCTTTISLDPLYVKAYLRRASARLGQNKLPEAMCDYERILMLEPQNKHAKSEITRIKKLLACSTDGVFNDSSSEKGVVKPIYKPIEQRSKKPLKRLKIEELGQIKTSDHKEKHVEVLENTGQDKNVASQDEHLLETCTSSHRTCTTNTRMQVYVLTNGAKDGRTEGSSEHTEKNLGLNSHTVQDSNVDMDVPDVPQTSFQFQTTYKIIKNNPKAFYNYFKKIEPSNLCKLFGQSIDADVIMKIFISFKDFFIPDGLDVLPFVQELATVNRFDMTVMFLSAREKQVFKDVFDHLRTKSNTSSEAIEILAKKYQL